MFGPGGNPLSQLGALGFYAYWIVAVSGIYVYLFFDTGITAAYDSLEYLTVEQWYLGGVMRSLHRYASDAMVLFMALHMLREFSFDRYRGVRWFSWFTGVPIIWLLVISGLTGYWLVWDVLAQYIAISTTEWLDWLAIFGEPVASNFQSTTHLDDRFFTLMIFLHIAAPLILLFLMWLHITRMSRAKINPSKPLAIGMMLMMLVLSLVYPAVSQAPADLEKVPSNIGYDWFYLFYYPLMDNWPKAASWGFGGALTLILFGLPWLPPFRKQPTAVVTLDECNGCTRCAEDCPYNAITMQMRTDGKPFEREAVVDPEKCVSCGICAGACPTSTPFRRASALVPGIELPNFPIVEVRRLTDERCAAATGGPRVLVYGCFHGVAEKALAAPNRAVVSLPCTAMLPPAFIDYAISKGIADGVFLTGCAPGSCQHRNGVAWTEARLNRERDPMLRRRVPEERLARGWGGPGSAGSINNQIKAFEERLKAISGDTPAAKGKDSTGPEPKKPADAEVLAND